MEHRYYTILFSLAFASCKNFKSWPFCHSLLLKGELASQDKAKDKTEAIFLSVLLIYLKISLMLQTRVLSSALPIAIQYRFLSFESVAGSCPQRLELCF